LDVLDSLFWQVSDPFSSHYRDFFSREQILALIAPPASVQEDIINWVNEVSFTLLPENRKKVEIRNLGDVIHVKGPVELAEKLFQTELYSFTKTEDTSFALERHLGSLSIPTNLYPHIDMITGITNFPPPSRPPRKKTTQEKIAENICNVPYSIKNLYSVPLDLVVSNPAASQAPYAEASGKKEGFGTKDLAVWQEVNGLAQNPITNIIGNSPTYVPKETDGEAQLDVQYLTGLAPNANTSFWIMSSNFGWMYEWATTVFNTLSPPLVNSISYGWYEIEQCQSSSSPPGLGNCDELHFADYVEYIRRTETEFQKLGTMGLTILAASGDNGVEPTFDCNSMRPNYPASSQFVTSVGATAVVNALLEEEHTEEETAKPTTDPPRICTEASFKCQCATSSNEEAAMSTNNAHYDTGGGFSSIQSRPSYQDEVVQQYLNSDLKKPSLNFWNSSNRGYPDVSAVGASVAIINAKEPAVQLVGGTSASAPIIAGLLTLINQDQLNNNRPPIGFANPLLYAIAKSNPNAFKDITKGTNGATCKQLAFTAGPGWDPLSGLGTPNFAVLRQEANRLLSRKSSYSNQNNFS